MTALVEQTKHPLLYKAVCEFDATSGDASSENRTEPWRPGPRIDTDAAQGPYTEDELKRAETALEALTEEERHQFATGDEETVEQFETRGPDFKLAADILFSCFAEQ